MLPQRLIETQLGHVRSNDRHGAFRSTLPGLLQLEARLVGLATGQLRGVNRDWRRRRRDDAGWVLRAAVDPIKRLTAWRRRRSRNRKSCRAPLVVGDEILLL